MIADLCLVLLLDSSGSIDAGEWDLQAEATAEALSTTAIVEKITRGQHGHIAVMAMEFADRSAVMLPWTDIAGMADARRVAVILATYQRRMSGSTAVGDALQAAAAALEAAPACVRHVVGLSTDGARNDGTDPVTAVNLLQGRDVMVNAVVIEDEPGGAGLLQADRLGLRDGGELGKLRPGDQDQAAIGSRRAQIGCRPL